MMNTTQQPVAIVTGASSGIGLGITQALLERGWRVVATSRTISESKDLKPSPDLVLVDGEVSKKETAVKVVDLALKHFGRIDLLVNNAGIFIPKPFTEYTEDDYNRVMNTNVASFFFMTQQVIPQMKKQNSGHVVNISGLRPCAGYRRRLGRTAEHDHRLVHKIVDPRHRRKVCHRKIKQRERRIRAHTDRCCPANDLVFRSPQSPLFLRRGGHPL